MTTITGDNGNNNLTGTNGADTINGRQGNDVINGLDGNDTIIAGNGNNTITDGNGNDTITAGNGNNTITAGNGNDTVTAGNGNNNVTVGNGTDSVTVGNGNNTITAGSGADTITTGNGNNTISSGGGNDVIQTGNGNDTVDAGAGNDQVFTTGGNDLVIYNMSANTGSHDTANGGKGIDTLRLQLTQQQFNNAAVQADLAAYHTFLAAHQNTGSDTGATFHFTAFDLSVSNFEVVNVVIVNSPVVISSGPESSTVAEQDNTTGSAASDTTPTTPAGTLAFTDADTGDTHTVAVTLASTSDTVPAATQADLATAVTTVLHDSTGTGSGSVDWNFAIPDKDLDYLAAGQTLTVDYNVKISDGSTTATQTVELVVTGSNDAVAITSGPQVDAVAEQTNTIGSTSPDTTPTHTLNFTDVDLTDTHTVSVAVDSAVWSGGDFVPADTLNDLQTALATTLHDSTGSGHGGIDWQFSLADKDLDFLNAGDTLTVTYDVTVSDGTTTSTQQVTITATGAEDTPVVNPDVASIFDTTATDNGNLVALGNMITDAGDTAGDIGNTLSVSDVNGTPVSGFLEVAGTYGTLDVFGDGTYLYFANAALDGLVQDQHENDLFNFTVTDSFGHSTATTLTFNVTGSDEAPQITAADAFGSLTEDAGPNAAVNGGFETGDFTGWIASGPVVEFDALGGGFGNYTVNLSGGGLLEQDVATTAGQHYTLSFDVAGDPDASSSSFAVFWDGAALVPTTTAGLGFTQYTFDVVGDASASSTQFLVQYNTDGSGMHFDQFSVSPTPGPATEATEGAVHFTDVDPGDTHTASFTPHDNNYVGTFSLDPVSESGGSGSVEWHFSVDNADIQFLAQGQSLTQVYTVAVTDADGASGVQDISVTLNGSNDAPTAVNDTIVTDAGAGGTIDIPTFALALNDTDPDTTDHVSISHVVSASGGATANNSTDVFFFDDATSGGSFDYNATDGIATSANNATATIVNNATSSTMLTAGSGDSILIATNGTETLQGGAGNDVLIGNSGSHTMSGGGGNDTFAFLNTSDGLGIITDFNNTTEHDHIAVSASGYGGPLTAGMDVSSIFQTTGDNQTNGISGFLFDTANQTLYFSADGTQDTQIALAQVQPGVTINPHDLLIV